MTSGAMLNGSPEDGLIQGNGLCLVLNGAEERLQILLLEQDQEAWKQLVFQEWSVYGRAMQVLAPALEQLLTHLGRTPAEITRIACVRGPGSFTGLRLVMATALGLAQATGASMAGLDYLPLLAANAPDKTTSCMILTHSRRRQVYLQHFSPDPDCPAPEPRDLPQGLPMDQTLDQALTLLREQGVPCQVLGSGLIRNLDFFQEADLPQATLLPDPALSFPTAQALARAAETAEYGPEPFEPLYLRGSDAEENLAAIAAKRGLSEDEARATLDDSRPAF